MAMLETSTSWREKWLNEFRLSKLVEEAERVASDVLVGVLKIVSDAVAVLRKYMLVRL